MLLAAIAIVVGTFTLIYFFVTSSYGYFKSKGVPEDPGAFPFGSTPMWQMFMGKRGFVDSVRNL